ncbi:MAG: DUF2235 domain-containing protein [Desulfofustis sp.]|nr:DUF2235 domain-containing protein [Desulfofustis sp.]
MKRIILCADGTWNEPERKDKKTGRLQPTNVLKVARAIMPRSRGGIDQVVYYHQGVGTDGGLDKFTGGAFGRGMEQNVRALYRFLVFNFEPGDELFLFGFSRGAFTVRTLAGFMNQVGLLEKDDEYYTPEIYGLYQSSTQKGSPEWQHAFRNISGTRPCPAIQFIGVWDTVGALGAPGVLGQLVNPGKYKYHDIGLNTNIEHAFHALAIDERRKPFLPSMWIKPHNWSGTLEQVWFPGVHSNVGGSYSPDGLANEALHWMVEKAENLGLEFDANHLGHYLPCFNSVLNDSMTTFYNLMGPVQRKLGEHIGHGEAIHQSALDRQNLAECAYDPDNLKSYLASGSAPIVNTHRIARGTPCT